MTWALELVAELAVVEDASHVGADGGEALDLLTVPDEKALDGPRAEGDGEAVAAGPLVVLPHAASNSAVHGTMMADRPKLRKEAITRVGTDEGYG